MVRAIKAKLEQWSPAVFVGHNSMHFDEHLLRQAFYQTLHPPYLTNTNGNGRMDSLPVLQAAHLLEPGMLTVPVGDKGRPTFSLERLAPANGFDHAAAHDAVGDVEATLHLCRLVRLRAEALWSNCVRFARKAAVLDYAQPGEVFAYVGSSYGRTNICVATALGCESRARFGPVRASTCRMTRTTWRRWMKTACTIFWQRVRSPCAACAPTPRLASCRTRTCRPGRTRSCRVSRNWRVGLRRFGRTRTCGLAFCRS